MHVTCSACGLNCKIPANEPSGFIRCAGCGKRLRWGEAAATEQVMLPVTDTEDDIGFSFMAPVDEPVRAASVSTPKKKEPIRKGKHNPVVAASAAALVAVMIGVLVLLIHSSSQHIETANTDQNDRAKLVALKNSADTLALAGKYQEAYQKYNQVILAGSGSDTKDPVILEMVVGARTGQDRVMGLMMSSATTAGTLATAAPKSLVDLPTRSDEVSMRVTTAPSEEPTTAPVVAEVTAVSPATRPLKPDLAAVLTPQQRLADEAPAIPGPPPPRLALRSYTLGDGVTDKEIGIAIGNGVQYLAGQFKGGIIFGGPDGQPARTVVPPPEQPVRPPSQLDEGSNLKQAPPPPPLPPPPPQQGTKTNFVAPFANTFSRCGLDALAVYALLNAGRALDTPGLGENDPFTKDVLEKLKHFDTEATYHRSLRAAALAVFNRSEDNAALEEDLRWLQAASHGGAYTYDSGVETSVWDNSNSQYGLLGVWSGAQVGKYVPQKYWQDVNSHWTECADPLGLWGYRDGFSFTMTCAGVASLLVTRDYLDSFDTSNVGGFAPHRSPLADGGLAWLDTSDNSVSQIYDGGMGGAGYALYGLERVGLASGFKYFGDHDWYSELAKHLVHEQHLDGSWYGHGASIEQTAIDTSYALLFLARGRHPILYNKLRYEGNWNNRPSDVAHLARFAANALERPLNWQVVNVRRNWFDWLDAPLLFISGDKAPNLRPADYNSLRQYTEGGGLIFTHADNGSVEFSRWVETLVRKIYPKYELTRVPLDDPIYSVVYPLKNPPRLRSVTNGSRLLLIDSPADLAGGWQLNWKDAHKTEFQLGVNIFVYAEGKQIFKNRLASTYIPPDPDPVTQTARVARIQYYSDWDPEPYAWERFSRYFQWETHGGLVKTRVRMADLKPDVTPMAVVTGTVAYDFLPEEVAAAKAYVGAGGVLFIDSCGGQRAFAKSVETTLLPLAFPGAVLKPIPSNHPLLVPSRKYADDLTKPLLRGFANENNGREFPIEGLSYGKGWVIFSRLDVTTGLLGTSSWGIFGYDPAYAQALMKNAVLWALARNSPQAAKTPTNGS